MRRITYFTKRNQIKIEKRRLGNLILKYDVIHEALKVICNKNLKRPQNLGDIGSFGDIGTGRNYAKNREIAGDWTGYIGLGICSPYVIKFKN